MTPKEKAEELVNKMAFEVCKTDAKQCALIAVDEIIETYPLIEKYHPFFPKRFVSDIPYWQEVKQEIEKL